MFLVVSLFFPLSSGHLLNSTCSPDRSVDEPIAHQEGDYIVAAIFQIGQYKVEKKVDEAGTMQEVEYCSYSDPGFYRLQKALIFRQTMKVEIDRFR